MSDIITREIIGLAQKSKWNKIKEFIKALVKNTLKKNAGYTLVALDVSINNTKKQEFSCIIHSYKDLYKIDEINSFSNLSLYQHTDTSTDHISISQQNGIIILMAKYMGPAAKDYKYFDFMVHMDPINDPFFTYGSGEILSCSEMLKSIKKNKQVKNETSKKEIAKDSKSKPKITKTTAKSQPKQKNGRIKTENIESLTYENSKSKKAIWGGTETKAFTAWKEKTANEYKKQTGKVSYYKGKPTKNYGKYLADLSNPRKRKTHKKKSIPKKKSVQTKKDVKPQDKIEKEISEPIVYEKLTNKKAFWGGSETKTFIAWKEKTANKYKNQTGKVAYYRGNSTKNYKKYLEHIVKPKSKSKSKKKTPIKKNSIQKKKVTKSLDKIVKEISEPIVYEKLTDKKAFRGGSETKIFIAWKEKTANEYKKQTGKVAYYRGNPTKNYKTYLEHIVKPKSKSKSKKNTPIKKNSIQKKKDVKPQDKIVKEISEPIVYEKLTNKKAFRGGSETKTFIVWKDKIVKKFQSEMGGKTHYRGKLTKNYIKYLEKLTTS